MHPLSEKSFAIFPQTPSPFWQKVKNSLPQNPKSVPSRGFWTQSPVGLCQSGVFDLFAKKSSGLWGHKGTIRKTQKPQKPDASRPKKEKMHNVQKPRLSRAKGAEGPFGAQMCTQKAFLAEGQKVPQAPKRLFTLFAKQKALWVKPQRLVSKKSRSDFLQNL